MARVKKKKVNAKRRKGAPVSPAKARTILREGRAGGRKLSAKQKRFFGFLAGGGAPTKLKKKRKKK